ncbi:ABC transporter substrate-binding protein, partial [Acinetobacter baumannii]
MKRKLLPVVGASILATSLLVGCSGRNEVLNSTDATKSTSKVTEVTFWHSMGGKGGEAIETLVSEFNSSQSNIKVVAEYQGSYDDSINKLKSAALGNSGPDIMQLYEVGTKWMID